MEQDWWREIMKSHGDPWELGYSEPAGRALWNLNQTLDGNQVQALKDLLIRLRREGVPINAWRIRADVPIFRVEEAGFRLQVFVLEDKHILAIERLRQSA